MLITLGFSCRNGTGSTVKAFQRATGLKVDGLAMKLLSKA